jgi:hypothetical protein
VGPLPCRNLVERYSHQHLAWNSQHVPSCSLCIANNNCLPMASDLQSPETLKLPWSYILARMETRIRPFPTDTQNSHMVSSLQRPLVASLWSSVTQVFCEASPSNSQTPEAIQHPLPAGNREPGSQGHVSYSSLRTPKLDTIHGQCPLVASSR